MDPHAPYQPRPADLDWVRSLPVGSRAFPGPQAADPDGIQQEEWLRYLAEVVDLDRELGRLIEALKHAGRYDSATLIVVSDHGEEFLEHGQTQHGKSLYDEVVRVPALVKFPGSVPAGVVSDAVSMQGLLATVFPELGFESVAVGEPPSLRSLLVKDRAGPGQSTQVARLKLDGRRLSSVVDGNWKLIVDHKQARSQLFDLSTDPGEVRDLADAQPAQASRLRLLLDRIGAEQAQGWHVLACGAARPHTLEVTISTSADVHTVSFEPEDEIDASRDTVQLDLDLAPTSSPREFFGQIRDVFVADRDEIVFSAERGEESAPLRIQATQAAELIYALAHDRELRSAERVELDAADGRVRVPAGSVVECGAGGGPLTNDGENEIPPSDPYLRIWYVPAPEALAQDEIAPEVIDRLKGLGYME